MTYHTPEAVKTVSRKETAKTELTDVIAMVAFSLFAIGAHGMSFAPRQILETSGPFLIGLFFSSIILGLLGWSNRPVRPAGLTIWFFTVAIGVTIRATIKGELPHWSFIVVAAIMSALLLLGWRALDTWLTKKA